YEYRHTLQRIMETRSWMEPVRRGRPVRFWYDPSEPVAEDTIALNSSYLYSYSLWESPLPELACGEPPPPGTVAVAVSMREDTTDLAHRVVGDCAARAKLVATVAASRTTQHPKGRYSTALLTLDH